MKPIIVFTLVGIFLAVVPIDARSFSFPGKPVVEEHGSRKRSLQFDNFPLPSTPAKDEDNSNDVTPPKNQVVLFNSHSKVIQADTFFNSRHKGRAQSENSEKNEAEASVTTDGITEKRDRSSSSSSSEEKNDPSAHANTYFNSRHKGRAQSENSEKNEAEASVTTDEITEKRDQSSSSSSSEEENDPSAHASIESTEEEKENVEIKEPQLFLPFANAPTLNHLADSPEAQAAAKEEKSRGRRQLLVTEEVKLEPKVRKISTNLAGNRKQVYKVL